jgi:hypothetical protein
LNVNFQFFNLFSEQLNVISNYQHKIPEIPFNTTGYSEKFCGEMLELEVDHVLPVPRFVSEVVPPFPHTPSLRAQE